MDWYERGYGISFVIIFLCSWAYCTAIYGFLFGFGLGWIPSLILAGLASFLWPVLLPIAAALVIFVVNLFMKG